MREKRTSKSIQKVLTRPTRIYSQKPAARSPKVDWARIKKMKDKDIDYSDIPATDEAFWADAEWVVPEQKVALGVRFDRDVVDWFKSEGPGYQTRMNAVLRVYMEHNKKRR